MSTDLNKRRRNKAFVNYIVMAHHRGYIVMASLAMALGGCSSGGDDLGRLGEYGETCARTADCRPPLRCVAEQCISENGVDSQAGVDAGDSNEISDSPPDTTADACSRNCSLRSCGDDGCGGVCGTCDAGQQCSPSGNCPSAVVGQWQVFSEGVVWDSRGRRFWRTQRQEVDNWSTAQSSCIAVGDGRRWRVPNISELRSLVKNCPAIESGGECRVSDPNCLDSDCDYVDYYPEHGLPGYRPGCICSGSTKYDVALDWGIPNYPGTGTFWSSSSASSVWAWSISFNPPLNPSSVIVDSQSKTYSGYVRCVSTEEQ